MSATDELRRLLDERGVEWSKGAYPNEARTYWHDTVARPWNEQRVYVHAILTPEQAVEATLGRGACRRMTADDVRDLIERHSNASGGNGRDFHNGAYAAIADELNAELGIGVDG